jgi:hypothetical protein
MGFSPDCNLASDGKSLIPFNGEVTRWPISG